MSNSKLFMSLTKGKDSFDLSIAHYLAHLSNVVYEPENKIKKSLSGYHVQFFTVKGTQAFLAVHKKPRFAVLCFRGTEYNFEDILTNINIFKGKTNDGQGKVHKGFYNSIQSVWKRKKGLCTALEQLPDSTPVYYTGHSLGGALATLAFRRKPGTALYTFGSPRVMSGKGMKEFSSSPNIFRIVNSTDIVPRVPPFFFFYSHIGKQIFLSSEGKIVTNSWELFISFFEGLIAVFSLALSPKLLKTLLYNTFINHQITSYINALKKLDS